MMIQLAICMQLHLQGASFSCCSRPVDPPRLLMLADEAAPAGVAAREGSGSVTGTVRAPGHTLPAEMVVYLEPKDANLRIPAPETKPRVSQKGAQFAPSLTLISVGQTVEFVNDEDRSIEHNVFSNSPAMAFDLGMFPQRQTRSVKFDVPGPVMLYCSVHKFMDGVVFVSPTPFFSRVDEAGKFQMEHVVPGDYVLKLWQRRPRFPETFAPITVAPGQTLTTNLELRRK